MVIWAAVAWPAGVDAQTTRATVQPIGDADTIKVRHGSRSLSVLLACIDAPELNLSHWGQVARHDLDAEFRAQQRRHGVWQVEGGITRPWESRRRPGGHR